jgi:hypothetical protein
MRSVVNAQIGERLRGRLIARAEAEEVSPSEIVRRAIQSYCERQEERERLAAPPVLEHAA